MQTQKGYHELEKVVINRIQKVPTEAGEKTYWQDFHAAISSAIEQERDSNKGRFQMLDMSAWCESKITGKSIRELIEKKAT